MSEESKEKYYAYLQTDTWKQIRDTVVRRDRGRCRICNSSKFLNVHHRKYPDVYGEELLIDLITLCKVCHELFHFITIPSKVFKSKKLPKAKPTSPYLRKAKEKLRLQGINADGNIQRVAKIICKYKGIKYLPQGQRNKTNCLVIIKEYIATKDD